MVGNHIINIHNLALIHNQQPVLTQTLQCKVKSVISTKMKVNCLSTVKEQSWSICICICHRPLGKKWKNS